MRGSGNERNKSHLSVGLWPRAQARSFWDAEENGSL